MMFQNSKEDLAECNPTQSVIAYVQQMKSNLIHYNNIEMVPSVDHFRKFIKQNPVVRLQFQGAINQIPKQVPSFEYAGRTRPGILYGMTIDEVLDLFNIAAQFPPPFSATSLCAVPFTILRFDLANTELGKAFFSRADVNQYLKNIFDDYALMLKSQKSLKYFTRNQDGWFCEQGCRLVDYSITICDPSAPHFGFKSWNDWFTRRLIPSALQVDEPNNPLVITHVNQNFPFTNIHLPVRNIKATDQFWLKETRYSLYDMFEADKMGVKQIIDESFVGGSIYQGFLTAWCYHHWHAPVTGTIERIYNLPGSYFLQNPSFDVKETLNFRRSQPFLGHVATRQVFIINTHNELVGRVAIIQIGMAEVSSCISTVKQGDAVKKGDVIGRFELGGSSHIIVFDRRANLEFNPNIYDRQVNNGWSVSKVQKANTWLARVIPLNS